MKPACLLKNSQKLEWAMEKEQVKRSPMEPITTNALVSNKYLSARTHLRRGKLSPRFELVFVFVAAQSYGRELEELIINYLKKWTLWQTLHLTY